MKYSIFYRFYVGTGTGKVLEYDMRYMNTTWDVISNSFDNTPVLTIKSIPCCEALVTSGLITNQIIGCYIYSYKFNRYSYINKLNILGPILSMDYNVKDEHFLISTRPNIVNNYVQQYFGYMHNTKKKISFNAIHKINSGNYQKHLLKSRYLCFNTNQIITAYNESKSKILLWDVKTGKELGNLPFSQIAYEFASIEKVKPYLIILDPNSVYLYECIEHFV